MSATVRAPSWPPRSFRGNRAVWWAVGSLVVLQLTFVYAPFMHSLFESEALPLIDWIIPVFIGSGIFVVIEVEKAAMRRRDRRAESDLVALGRSSP